MKIPAKASIPERKLTAYLLVPRKTDDKSGYLALAGFSLENWPLLQTELQQFVARHEAVAEQEDEYGKFYRVEGHITGPNGRKLSVVTIWLCLRMDGSYRFITLKPGRKLP